MGTTDPSRGGADRISMLRFMAAMPARRSGGIGNRKGAASSGVGTEGKRSKAASIASGLRCAVAPRAQKTSRPSTRAVTRTCAALRPSASTSVVHSNRSPIWRVAGDELHGGPQGRSGRLHLRQRDRDRDGGAAEQLAVEAGKRAG